LRSTASASRSANNLVATAGSALTNQRLSGSPAAKKRAATAALGNLDDHAG
jgi:hypothetical protein